jgi:multidrug resistance efflux pump
MLTVSLITMIFYFHPSTSSATLFYRTVPMVSEVTGRVAEVHVDVSASVKQGDVLFRLDSAKQEASLLTAKRKIAEVDAAMLAAQADVMKAEGQLQEARGSLQQAQDELVREARCVQELRIACRRCDRACARHAVADSGPAIADQDADAERALICPQAAEDHPLAVCSLKWRRVLAKNPIGATGQAFESRRLA